MSILFPFLAAKHRELHKGISAPTHIAHIASFPRDRDPRRKGRGLFQFECDGFLLHPHTRCRHSQCIRSAVQFNAAPRELRLTLDSGLV
jgi:hypothetical protein